jgi:hypothetical protein
MMTKDWMQEEATRAKARLEAVNAEIRRFARGDAPVHVAEGPIVHGPPLPLKGTVRKLAEEIKQEHPAWTPAQVRTEVKRRLKVQTMTPNKKETK